MGLDFKPAAVMVVVSVAYAVMNVLVKEAIDGGMSGLVLITLRQLVAVLFMAPVAFVTERNVGLKLTGEIVLLVFVSALLGSSLTQIFFFLGLQYTSPTFSCAFLNVVPAMTFLIALPFRMERVDVGSRAAVLKVLGSLACVAGAALLASYRGVVIAGGKEHIEGLTALLPPRNWVTGSAALLAACMSWSSWFLVQSRTTKLCPALYKTTTLMFFLSFLQVAGFSLVSQRSRLHWAPRNRVQLVAVIYSGLVGSGMCLLASTWCIKKKGPVFAAAFSPLTQIIVAGIGTTVLGEPLHLGSVLGSVVVVAGLYLLLWGKSKETKEAVVAPVQSGPESKVAVEAV
ncbi:hypothetical protein HPP92_025857 [Vanilla planifolia]|uniref:WAT1-related protein n=1 Tax=Vanilla planifolia TaxID=51239 RepID=A0A835PIA8_VANPL|nr:hypothetical protein HPP92_025857 [Vanilla planifolia]